MLHDLDTLARKAAGNWQKFENFGWYDKPDQPRQWCIVYTSNRDSRLLDQSNADAIGKELEPFIEADEPDVIPQSHSHWAVGHVDGYVIRVYRDGQITDAFRKWCEIQDRLEDYPVLDESDYSQREYDATMENIKSEGEFVARRHDYALPNGWEAAVFDWFWDNNQHAVANRDDDGGYPSEDELIEAFDALGYPTDEAG
jgi:hypothetical protein